MAQRVAGFLDGAHQLARPRPLRRPPARRARATVVAAALKRGGRRAASPCASPTTPTMTSASSRRRPGPSPELIEALPFPTCGIPGIPDLMHHKYVVRDGESVWTGSTNWTTDSWTIQENFVVRADSPELASAVHRQLRGAVVDPRRRPHRPARAAHVSSRRPRGAGLVHARPGRGALATHRPRDRAGARADPDRLAGASPPGPVLGTLAEVAAEARVDLRGVVDRTQMERSSTSGAQTAARPGRSRSSPRSSSTPTSAASSRSRGRRTRSTTSCTRRSRWPTTGCSPARSTSRARVR